MIEGGGNAPLDGVRVLDLSSVVLGPLATQIMGDLGADVIKIEAPEGDTTRYTGPARTSDMAALFMGVNRNKRSLVLDLKQPAACDALWRLVDGADVFIHSIRPQKIARLGFSHEAVLARNPRIIYAGLHGYLSGGPYAGQPAYDDVIQGQSGSAELMAMLVDEPRYLPTIMADKTCAMVAAYGVMAALFQRERTKEGQFVEVPMFESMVAFNMIEHLYGHTFEPPEGPMGYTRVLSPWRKPYATSDGHICMMVYTDDQWHRFWDHVAKPELAHDPRFLTLSDRSANITELYRIVGECVAGKTTAHWVGVMADLDIPAAPVATLEDLESDAQLDAVGFFRKLDHPTEGPVVIPDSPVRFGGATPALARLQPKLGEHSIEILREAGLGETEIESLVAAGASLDGKVKTS